MMVVASWSPGVALAPQVVPQHNGSGITAIFSGRLPSGYCKIGAECEGYRRQNRTELGHQSALLPDGPFSREASWFETVRRKDGNLEARPHNPLGKYRCVLTNRCCSTGRAP